MVCLFYITFSGLDIGSCAWFELSEQTTLQAGIIYDIVLPSGSSYHDLAGKLNDDLIAPVTGFIHSLLSNILVNKGKGQEEFFFVDLYVRKVSR